MIELSNDAQTRQFQLKLESLKDRIQQAGMAIAMSPSRATAESVEELRVMVLERDNTLTILGK